MWVLIFDDCRELSGLVCGCFRVSINKGCLRLWVLIFDEGNYFRSLPPLLEATPNAVQELTLAREIYEHAVVLSVKMEDQEAFERDFCQLKPYYTDARDRIPQSPQEYQILGLNLLRLLVQNRIAEFHTELELLSSTALESPCNKHLCGAEQSFMEGAYNRVLSARQLVPHETYVYFMDVFAKTDEIVGCGEKAYDSLSLNDAKQMFFVLIDKDLLGVHKRANYAS
ncbi:26S proteasome non-ATPase regulatory subunit 8 homolog A-like [Silene latifolia]|uniref:26S proteasome non-ATPase regulatory subunit 8 homolog A-like n=1 Tax=Silene latifolia TaxID=37657 RepID=UPI003D774B58